MNHVARAIHLEFARQRKLTGKGIGIAVLDTGIGYHPDITANDSCLSFFLDIVNHRRFPYDDNGHGTHICGILAGKGTANPLYRGIAPASHIVMIKILNQNGEGSTENVLAAITWLLENKEKYNLHIVNLSVGSTTGRYFSENSPLVLGVNQLWEAGYIVLTAAGNHGPKSKSIGAPGNSRKIITVGASDALESNNDYSGRGPTENCIKKPDIVAPGSDITSCHPSPLPTSHYNQFAYLRLQRPDAKIQYVNGGAYTTRSGTSMSTPVVAGCIALLLQKNPNLKNKEVKLLLKESALDLGYPHSMQGWGMIQLDRFLTTKLP